MASTGLNPLLTFLEGVFEEEEKAKNMCYSPLKPPDISSKALNALIDEFAHGV